MKNPDNLQPSTQNPFETADREAINRLKQAFEVFPPGPLPFAPTVESKAEEGNIAVSFFNSSARNARDQNFIQRQKAGFCRPVIVSEGDSWFQYPVFLDDIIDNISQVYPTKSLGGAGDTLRHMLKEKEFVDAIKDTNADFLLISAAGNDVLGQGHFSALLTPFQKGMTAADILNQTAADAMLDTVCEGYTRIFEAALKAKSDLYILTHGYDYAIPRPGGKWLGMPLQEARVPENMWDIVIIELIDKLHKRLSDLAENYKTNVRHIDCRKSVTHAERYWYDEIHPNNLGFSRIAERFIQQIRTLWHSHSGPNDCTTRFDTHADPSEQAPEKSIDENIPGETEAVRGSASHAMSDALDRRRSRHRLVPVGDESGFERILGKSNLFPVNYLSRGARAAKAVAEVQFSYAGMRQPQGTGFLIGPGLFLTNNHVIGTPEIAQQVRLLFDYEHNEDFESRPTHTFSLTPDLFFTSAIDALDFTFVSVEPVNSAGTDLARFGHLTLVEESGKALLGEYVSIIQHPGGRPKSIAMRDSRVTGLDGDFILYSADTERGSSGSPVFNDHWLPVALHNSSVPDPDTPEKWLANRGTRISAIIRTLRKGACEGGKTGAMACRILALLDLENCVAFPPPCPNVIRPLRPSEDQFMAPPVLRPDMNAPNKDEP